MILIVYIIYERLKGEESFFWPYFNMVEIPLPTCYWPDSLLERSDCKEFRYGMFEARSKCDIEWQKLQQITSQYPELFSVVVTKDDYLWALGLVQTRAFGWGLPCLMVVPLADCLNHSNETYIGPDIVDPDLHKSMDKTYLYRHNFDKTVKTKYNEDDLYDKSASRLRINCATLFSVLKQQGNSEGQLLDDIP